MGSLIGKWYQNFLNSGSDRKQGRVYYLKVANPHILIYNADISKIVLLQASGVYFS